MTQPLPPLDDMFTGSSGDLPPSGTSHSATHPVARVDAGGWLDPADVAIYMGSPGAPDPSVIHVSQAAARQVELWRSELDWTATTDRATVPEGPHIYEGAVMYAALLWSQRNTPDGSAGWEDGGGLIGAGDSAKMTSIYRILRARRPRVG